MTSYNYLKKKKMTVWQNMIYIYYTIYIYMSYFMWKNMYTAYYILVKTNLTRYTSYKWETDEKKKKKDN